MQIPAKQNNTILLNYKKLNFYLSPHASIKSIDFGKENGFMRAPTILASFQKS